MFHSCSAFTLHHKAYLWLYESAQQFIALTDGPNMDPPITQAQACALAQPYWEWDTGFNDRGDKAINIALTDIFVNPEFFGCMKTPNDTYYVSEGLFKEFPTTDAVCNPSRQLCDKKLKREFNTARLTIGNQILRDQIWRNPTFKAYGPLIHGVTHGQVHSFVGCAMGTTDYAGTDPLFHLHHTNIDRFWHLWLDCHDYELIDPDSLTNNCTQYVALNPMPENLAQSQWKAVAVNDKSKRHPVGLDDKVNLYSTAGVEPVFCLQSEFPTIRQMWTLGTNEKHGWLDLFYRYGPDKIASRLSTEGKCKPTWTWVNQPVPVGINY